MIKNYQERAMDFVTESDVQSFAYASAGLTEEVGELQGKVAKMLRKKTAYVSDNRLHIRNEQSAERQADIKAIKYEIGDCLWMLAFWCEIFGTTLEEVMEMNIEKLTERRKNGTIIGNGDGVTKEERL